MASVACLSTPNSFGWATPNSIFRPCPPTTHLFVGRSAPGRRATGNLPLGLTSRRANPSFVSSSLLCLASASFRPLRPRRHNPSLLSLRHHDPQHHSLLPNLITSTASPVPTWIEPCYSPTRPASTTRTHVSTSNCPLAVPTHLPPARLSCTWAIALAIHPLCASSSSSSFSPSSSLPPHAVRIAPLQLRSRNADTLTYALSTLHRARRIALVRSTASIVLAIEVRYPSTCS